MHESSFPTALLAKLGEILQPSETEVYTGQSSFQAEVRSMIKLLTPINEKNLKEVRRKVFKLANVEEVKSASVISGTNRLAMAAKRVLE